MTPAPTRARRIHPVLAHLGTLDDPTQQAILDELRRVLVSGAAPPGSALPLDDLAHLGTVLALLPEAAGVELARRWGTGVHELARRALTEVLVRFGDERADDPSAHVVGPAHGWIVLAAGPT